MMFILGIIIGFFVSFFVLKHQIQKDGAGQLKCCKSCPYYNTPIQTSDSEEIEHDGN